MRRGWLLGVMAALVCVPAMAQHVGERVAGNEARIRDLERQIDMLRKANADQKGRIDEATLPARDVIESYLKGKGLAGMTFVDSQGHPLEESVRQISLWGGLRMRYETVDNMTDFSDDVGDRMSFVNNRLNLGIGLQFNEKVEAQIELRANYLSGGGSGLNNLGAVASDPAALGTIAPGLAASFADQDTLSVYQAFVVFKDVGVYLPLDVIVGRQELAYGSGFLLGNENFGPGLSWDAICAVSKMQGLQVDVFAAKLVENDALMDLAGNVDAIDPAVYDDGDSDAELYGVYASYTGYPDVTLDGYVLYVRSGLDGTGWDGWDLLEPAYNMGVLDKMNMITLGGRAEGSFGLNFMPGRFDYNAEVAFQLGNREPAGADEQDISALGAQAQLKYTMTGVAWKPAIGVLYAHATGDGDAGDDDFNQFNPLFQYNHGVYGLSDALRTSNVQVIGLTISAEPTEKMQIGAAWYMSLAEDDDDVLAGGVVWDSTFTNTTDDTDIANEIDLWLDMELNRRCRLQLGYALVLPGEYIKDLVGEDDSASRLYANLEMSF